MNLYLYQKVQLHHDVQTHLHIFGWTQIES